MCDEWDELHLLVAEDLLEFVVRCVIISLHGDHVSVRLDEGSITQLVLQMYSQSLYSVAPRIRCSDAWKSLENPEDGSLLRWLLEVTTI